jgi:hypothetical protein
MSPVKVQPDMAVGSGGQPRTPCVHENGKGPNLRWCNRALYDLLKRNDREGTGTWRALVLCALASDANRPPLGCERSSRDTSGLLHGLLHGLRYIWAFTDMHTGIQGHMSHSNRVCREMTLIGTIKQSKQSATVEQLLQ